MALRFLNTILEDIDWIATEMRPLTNETFVVFQDKVCNFKFDKQ